MRGTLTRSHLHQKHLKLIKDHNSSEYLSFEQKNYPIPTDFINVRNEANGQKETKQISNKKNQSITLLFSYIRFIDTFSRV